MAAQETSPAKRTYRVWADDTQWVFQDIEAESPKQAIDIAQERIDSWEPCDEHDSDRIHTWSEVKDLATEETFRVDEHTHCKTCGSEIVETVNDSLFGDGECGGCEYGRYRSQPSLLAACEAVSGLLYRDKNDVEQIDFADYERAELACKEAVASARSTILPLHHDR